MSKVSDPRIVADFLIIKGANFGFDDEFLYNKKKFFYGFDVEHKGYKRKNQKKLTIFGNLYDYHLSMYKLSAHFQHPLARVSFSKVISEYISSLGGTIRHDARFFHARYEIDSCRGGRT